MTWAQLGRHKKPILLANVKGFWDPLSALLQHMRETRFIRYGLNVEIHSAEKAEDIIPKLRAAAQATLDAEKLMTADTPAGRM
jgi:predicted Rossmann-fold nucleotide-binding protein